MPSTKLVERAKQIVRDYLACVMLGVVDPLFEWEHRELMKLLGEKG